MLDVSITPLLAIRDGAGRTLGALTVELLVGIDDHGSLAAACNASGSSYRHGWQLLREAEQLFGQPLLTMTRGKGSQLTPLGQRLVWAQRRMLARLSPALQSLSSELGAEIGKALASQTSALRIHASHGFAVQALHDALARGDLAHELKYCGSSEALAALAAGDCDVAGFHVPLGAYQAPALAKYRRWLHPGEHRIVHLATRRQGFMVPAGNPKKIYDVADLARPDVRFINRQPGSGTRYLLDLMLAERGIAPGAVQGYEQCEFTHGAVAAFVASGMADVGLGVEVPARAFKLEFLPAQRERYLLLCRAADLDTPALRALLSVLGSTGFRHAVDALAGYEAGDCGRVQRLDELFPELN